MDAEVLPDTLVPIAVRAAVEGVPVRAIARILSKPSELVYASLHEQHMTGHLVELPPSDWPPTGRLSDRLPQTKHKPQDADILFACRRRMGLSNLEGLFLVVLLKYDRADKNKLHHQIEQARHLRGNPPDTELVDQKMVDVIICKLRKKLKNLDGRFIIETVWGNGYYIANNVKRLMYERIYPDGEYGLPNPERTNSLAAA